MVYLSPRFDCDIFVSYCHGIAPLSGESPLKTWSQAFIEALTADIVNLSPDLHDLQIWYDRKIDPTAKLTERLRETVQSSGILLILISNRYLESSWCQDERNWFESQIRQRSDGISRTFVVRIQATEHKRWPAFLLDDRGHTVIGFRFHPNPETPDDDVEPFGWPDLAYRPEEFRAEFARLRTTLCRRLRELKKQVEPQGPSAVTPVLSAGDRRPRIYLHGIGDDARLRGQIEDTLTAHSFEVVSLRTEPGETLSAWGEQSRKHIAFARRCDALALIHDPMNAEFDAELLDIADDQERISRERGAALPWAVLDASGQPLPRFAVARGAERFDLNDTGWSDRLDLWLKRARGDAAAPSP